MSFLYSFSTSVLLLLHCCCYIIIIITIFKTTTEVDVLLMQRLASCHLWAMCGSPGASKFKTINNIGNSATSGASMFNDGVLRTWDPKKAPKHSGVIHSWFEGVLPAVGGKIRHVYSSGVSLPDLQNWEILIIITSCQLNSDL